MSASVGELELYRALAHGYARRYAGLFDFDDLEALGDVALIEAFDDYDHEIGTFPGYLQLRVRRTVIEAVRQWYGRYETPLVIHDDERCYEVAAPSYDLDRLIDTHDALAALRTDQRLLVLAHAAGYSEVELAAVLGCHASRISQRLSVARRLLCALTAA